MPVACFRAEINKRKNADEYSDETLLRIVRHQELFQYNPLQAHLSDMIPKVLTECAVDTFRANVLQHDTISQGFVNRIARYRKRVYVELKSLETRQRDASCPGARSLATSSSSSLGRWSKEHVFNMEMDIQAYEINAASAERGI